MKALLIGLFLMLTAGFSISANAAADFGVAENALGGLRGIRYENVYTKVPTSGKLVSIKITDSGRIYYICREKTGYAIYHLEIRPIEGYKEKIEEEVKEKSRKWDQMHPDELLFTKGRYERELNKRLNKYREAVWVRNEIVVEEPPQKPERGGK
ncbi:MAG: hypothetical protein HY913_00325 [Desulfomonile tiedjei]|nr:hypothetical protein [Desulfomonile tiedjei]